MALSQIMCSAELFRQCLFLKHRFIFKWNLFHIFTFSAGHLINSPVFKKGNALIEYKNLLSKQQIHGIN